MKYQGLTTSQASALIEQHGPNQLPSRKNASALKLLLSQFSNLLTILLIVATVISFLLADLLDGILILLIVVLNVMLGFFQEYKASRELEALQKITTTTTRVIRDGQEIQISSSELVPGDIVVAEAGSNIPADGVLLEAHNFSVNEASLTGESMPVFKTTDPQQSEVYFGTSIVTGRAIIKVIQTGSNTRFGKIAITLSTIEDDPTPLEISLSKLAKTIAIIALGLSIILFSINYYQSNSLFDSFLSSVALLVASVPEGLPAIVTIVLTFGVRNMYQHKTLVRRLSSIESLGSATVICTDKTGTLTENKMSVQSCYPQSAQEALTALGIICNSASLVSKNNGLFDVLGDSTEGALLLWAKKQGLDPQSVKSQSILLEEIPFDSSTRYMSVLVKNQKDVFLITKGAPEIVLDKTKISAQRRQIIDQIFSDYAKLGLRVLAFASLKLPSSTTKIPKNAKLDFIGLVAIADTIRPNIAQSIAKASKAGIRTIMITGDSLATASYVAQTVGILKPGLEVFSGADLDSLSDSDLDQKLNQIAVFARTSPEQKLRIVTSLQRLGEIVAVTGDGVNDSLALKQADVGVAMGQTGTDVAKEASDIVILDDNYSTLVEAIEQGRVVYQNILKTTKFLLSGNLSEVLLIMVSAMFLLPTPLLPVQLLWVNFVTDGLPALALSKDGASSQIMNSPPRLANQNILNHSTIKLIAVAGTVMAIITFMAFYYTLQTSGLQMARIVAFTTIVFVQMIFVFLMRRHHTILSNKYLLASVAAVLIAQLAIVTIPLLQTAFKLS